MASSRLLADRKVISSCIIHITRVLSANTGNCLIPRPRNVTKQINRSGVALYHTNNLSKQINRSGVALYHTNNLSKQINRSGVALCHTNSQAKYSRHVNEAIDLEEAGESDEGPLLSDLRKRGLYSHDRYRHYHKYTIKDIFASEDKKVVTVRWDDGHISEFDAIWLRHLCHCKDCKHDTNGMLKIDWRDLPLDICVLSTELEGDRMLVFRWGSPDGQELHRGIIPVATLRCYCYSKKSIRDRRERRAMTFVEEKTIPEVEYEDFHASEKGLYECLTHVNDQGICVVKNVPTDDATFKKTATRIGPLLPTVYGETFSVFPSPKPVNAAYSSDKLALHMDLPFYEIAPGLQILHCWRFDTDTIGGASNFLDIHEMAHKFRQESPELFDRLARLPVTFNSIHYNRTVPVHMENQKTVFSLNHYGELVSVTYHPMTMGPTELPKEDMVPFYEAYTAFHKMVTQTDSKYQFKFSVGDFLVFNNRRVLHGRDAFTGSGRHLQGTYIDLSNFHSYVQALHNKYGEGRLASRSGSHSWL